MVRLLLYSPPCLLLTLLECTYDQPSNRKRIPDIRRVETKLKCAEAIVGVLLPGVDVYNPTFNLLNFLETIQKARVSKSDPSLHSSLVNITKVGLGNSNSSAIGVSNEIDEETGLPRGSALAAKYQKLSRDGTALPIASSEDVETNVLNTLYSPQSTYGSPENHVGREIKIILPPKHVASELIEAVWDNACVLFRFYHRPSFIRDLDLLYETDPDDYTNKQYKILPLVYSVMAVGVLFSMDKSDKLGFKDASEGYKYFVAARKLIDIADARDTYAIQSIVMMIIFLQCSARLSTCYSYIGVALRSALRAGLHRKVAYNFNPIELETRKRLFWTIRKMDIYVNAMLGLPRSVAEEDFDQELPEEIDDENITEDGYFPQKEGKLSSAGIANAHTRLITILSHIMKHIYPVKQDTSESNTSSTAPLYNVAHAKVAEMEAEIRQWLESLPLELRPGASPPPEYVKANRLLHLALCHIQIVLYRPFIHYCSPKFKGDEKARASALSCIKVSRTAMHIAHDLVSKKLLNGAYWFSIYTIFFSVACLVYYVHENPRDPEAYEIRRDAELGKNALTSLKDSSMSAQRTYNLLNTLFEQLNRRTAKIPVSGADGSPSAAATAGVSATSDGSLPGPQVLQQSSAASTPSMSSTSSVGSSKAIDQQIEFGAAASGVTDLQSNINLVPDAATPDTSAFYANAAAASSAPSLATMSNSPPSAGPGTAPPSTSTHGTAPVHVRGKRGRPPNSARRGVSRSSSGKGNSAVNTPIQTSKLLPTGSVSGSVTGTPTSQNASPINQVGRLAVSASPVDTSKAAANPLFADVLGASNNNKLASPLGESLFPDLQGFSFDPNAPSLPSNSNPNPAISSPSLLTSADGDNLSTTESPHFYVPGIMDQVDAQLFGRFLPPYMLQQTQSAPLGGSSGPHVGASTVGSNSGNGSSRASNGNSSTTTTSVNGSLPVTSAFDPFKGGSTTTTGSTADVGSTSNGNLMFANPDLDSILLQERMRQQQQPQQRQAISQQGASSSSTSLPQLGADSAAPGATTDGNNPAAAGASTNKANNNTNDANANLSFDDRRLSLSTLFNKNWDEFIAQHNELSGLNSFMTQ